jgi:hypothetical protein
VDRDSVPGRVHDHLERGEPDRQLAARERHRKRTGRCALDAGLVGRRSGGRSRGVRSAPRGAFSNSRSIPKSQDRDLVARRFVPYPLGRQYRRYRLSSPTKKTAPPAFLTAVREPLAGRGIPPRGLPGRRTEDTQTLFGTGIFRLASARRWPQIARRDGTHGSKPSFCLCNPARFRSGFGDPRLFFGKAWTNQALDSRSPRKGHKPGCSDQWRAAQ